MPKASVLVAAMRPSSSELALLRMPTASSRVRPARTETSSSVSVGSGFFVLSSAAF